MSSKIYLNSRDTYWTGVFLTLRQQGLKDRNIEFSKLFPPSDDLPEDQSIICTLEKQVINPLFLSDAMRKAKDVKKIDPNFLDMADSIQQKYLDIVSGESNRLLESVKKGAGEKTFVNLPISPRSCLELVQESKKNFWSYPSHTLHDSAWAHTLSPLPYTLFFLSPQDSFSRTYYAQEKAHLLQLLHDPQYPVFERVCSLFVLQDILTQFHAKDLGLQYLLRDVDVKVLCASFGRMEVLNLEHALFLSHHLFDAFMFPPSLKTLEISHTNLSLSQITPSLQVRQKEGTAPHVVCMDQQLAFPVDYEGHVKKSNELAKKLATADVVLFDQDPVAVMRTLIDTILLYTKESQNQLIKTLIHSSNRWIPLNQAQKQACLHVLEQRIAFKFQDFYPSLIGHVSGFYQKNRESKHPSSPLLPSKPMEYVSIYSGYLEQAVHFFLTGGYVDAEDTFYQITSILASPEILREAVGLLCFLESHPSGDEIYMLYRAAVRKEYLYERILENVDEEPTKEVLHELYIYEYYNSLISLTKRAVTLADQPKISRHQESVVCQASYTPLVIELFEEYPDSPLLPHALDAAFCFPCFDAKAHQQFFKDLLPLYQEHPIDEVSIASYLTGQFLSAYRAHPTPLFSSTHMRNIGQDYLALLMAKGSYRRFFPDKVSFSTLDFDAIAHIYRQHEAYRAPIKEFLWTVREPSWLYSFPKQAQQRALELYQELS